MELWRFQWNFDGDSMFSGEYMELELDADGIYRKFEKLEWWFHGFLVDFHGVEWNFEMESILGVQEVGP